MTRWPAKLMWPNNLPLLINMAAAARKTVMRAKILIKPTKAAEVISIDFTLLPTGADFTPFA